MTMEPANLHSTPRSRVHGAVFGIGVFTAVASVGFALVFSLLGIFPADARWLAVFVAVLGTVIGLIVALTARSRRYGRSTIVPALVTLLCAFVLTGGSIFGFLATCHYEGRQDPSNSMFGGLVLIGAGLFVLALLWVVVAAIFAFFRRRGASGEAGSPGGPQ